MSPVVTKWTVALMISVAASALVCYALIGNPIDPFDDRRFSAEAWKRAGADHDHDARARMCRDLMKRFVRPGMSEKQVVSLLGTPDRISDRRGPGGTPLLGVHLYEYPIGNWTFQRMDDAFLYVHFDSSDHVLKTEIYGY